MRWRVGRRPTSRSMDFTSCQGQPVSAERAAGRRSPTARASATVRGGVMDTAGPSDTYTIVASVTYWPEDATASPRAWGDSNLPVFARGTLALPPGRPMLGLCGIADRSKDTRDGEPAHKLRIR